MSRLELGHGRSGWLTATMHREPKLARRLLDRFEPVHGVTYFAPEAREALDGLGYKGYWMGYFAARSAPLGQVAPEVVTAIFYNFAPTRVAKALPAAWQIAGPEEALRVRLDTAVAVLRRYGLEADENVSTAAELLGKGREKCAAVRTTAVRREQRAAVAGRSAGRAVACRDAATRAPRRHAYCGPERGRRHGPGMQRAAFRVGGDPARLHCRAPAITTTRSGGYASNSWRRGVCSTTTGR